jgi:transcriptional regulator with XRE-family HTH domain
MAFDLNISVTAYSKIERGLTNITLERLHQISKCLEVSMVLLIEYYENEGMNEEQKMQEKSTYVRVSESEELTMSYLEAKIAELEENYQTLNNTVDILRNIIRDIFNKA